MEQPTVYTVVVTCKYMRSTGPIIYELRKNKVN